MDSKRIVQVFEPSETRVSSGYAIAQTLVLGSRHGMGNATIGSEVIVRGLDDLKTPPAATRRGTILWMGATIDAALIELPPDHPVAARISNEPSTFARLSVGGMRRKCVGTGFPDVMDVKKEDNDVYSFEGSVQRSPRQDLLLLELSQAPPNSKDWSGLSGAAVFCGRALVGIVRNTHGAVGSNALDADPIEKAFADPAFRAYLANAQESIPQIVAFEPRSVRPVICRIDRTDQAKEIYTHLEAIVQDRKPWPTIIGLQGSASQRHQRFVDRLVSLEIKKFFGVDAKQEEIFPQFDWPAGLNIEPKAEFEKWLRTAWTRLFQDSHPAPANLGDLDDCATQLHAAIEGSPGLCGFWFFVNRQTVTTGTGHGEFLDKWWSLLAKVKARGLARRFAILLCLVDDLPPPKRGLFERLRPAAQDMPWNDVFERLYNAKEVYWTETLVLQDIPQGEVEAWIRFLAVLLAGLPPAADPTGVYCDELEILKASLATRLDRSFSMEKFEINVDDFLLRVGN
jgi:hypothetical protein